MAEEHVFSMMKGTQYTGKSVTHYTAKRFMEELAERKPGCYYEFLAITPASSSPLGARSVTN